MEPRSALETYVPDRPPTWTEVGLAVLVLVTYVPQLVFDPPSVPALLVGFLAFAAALGPVSKTTIGGRIGHWFRRIGVTGRAVVIIIFAVAVAAMLRLEAVPSALVGDAALGGLLACALYLLGHILLAGEVSGWWTTDQ